MEQASLQLPAALERERAAAPEATKSPQAFRFLEKHLGAAGMKLAVAWTCLAAAIGSTAALEGRLPQRSLPAPAVSGPAYAPIAGLEEGDTSASVNALINQTYAQEGREVDIVGADGNARRALSTFMRAPLKKTPAPDEIVRIQDRELFAPELAANPNVYPFIIYNITKQPEQPVDIEYVDFALQAVRDWTNQVDARGGEITIGNHTRYEVDALDDPHALVFADAMPKFMPKVVQNSIEGRTTWFASNRNTRTFVVADGSAAAPLPPAAISTEICQSMVSLTDAQTVPGGSLQQSAWQRFIGDTHANGPRNPSARHDLLIAGKEAVCNGIGTVIAAYYQSGQPGLQGLPDQVAHIPTFLDPPVLSAGSASRGEPWIDFRIFNTLIPDLAAIKQEAPVQVITTAGSDAPTARYYRAHQLDGPAQPMQG